MVGQNNQQNLVLVIRERERGEKREDRDNAKGKKILRRRIRISINAQIGTG